MTFPSDYKVVKLPGSTTGVLDVYEGFERQILVDTQTWTLRLFDGTTPGGYPVVHLRDFASIFANEDVIEPGTRLDVEVATNTGSDTDLIAKSNKVMPWSPLVIRNLFEKIANTATAGTWRIINAAMPDEFKQAAKPVNDANDAILDGFYTLDPSSAANIPGAISTSTTRNLAMIVSCQSTDNVMQMLVERDNSAKIWIRVRLDGVWQVWVLATGVTSSDLNGKVSKAGDTMTGPLNMTNQPIRNILTINDGPIGGSDDCINGNFDVWQRATSATTSGYVAADRWSSEHVGTTKTVSQQINVLGDSTHGAKYFIRHLVSSVAGAGNYCALEQKVENVLRWAGKRITVTFEAKADSVKDMAIEGRQNFGTGGSPSAPVNGIGSQRVTLSTSWTKYSLVFDFPSVSGKVLGTADNDASAIVFWFDAGSSFNARTANLGQQSGTFDLRHVSFRIGDARQEQDPKINRLPQEEHALCLRFYESIQVENNGFLALAQATSSTTLEWVLTYARKRSAPTLVVPTTFFVRNSAGSGLSISSHTPAAPGLDRTRIGSVAAGGLAAGNASNVYSSGVSKVTIDSEI